MSSSPAQPSAARILLVVYGVASLLNVAGQALPGPSLAVVTKPLLMPTLFVWVLIVARHRRDRRVNLLLVGLVFAWAGDVLLMGSDLFPDVGLFFLLGLLGFFGMQVCYIAAFLTVPGFHLLKQGPLLALPLAVYWLVMNMMLNPGALRIPVMIYSVVLVGMSVTALDLVPRLPAPFGWRVFTGSVIFVVSDSLIALDAFGGLAIGAWQGVLVMATYTVAQYLIVTGFVRALEQLSDTGPKPWAPPRTTS